MMISFICRHYRMSKRVLADQLLQYLTTLRTYSCHSSVAKEWKTNTKLKDELTKFFNVISKGATRSIFLQMFDNFVQANPKSPALWIQYLQTREYCKGLHSSMDIFAKRGERIELHL